MKMPRYIFVELLMISLCLLFFGYWYRYGNSYWTDILFVVALLWIFTTFCGFLLRTYFGKVIKEKTDSATKDESKHFLSPDPKLQFDAYKHLTTLNVLVMAGLATVFPLFQTRFESQPVANGFVWGGAFITLMLSLIASLGSMRAITRNLPLDYISEDMPYLLFGLAFLLTTVYAFMLMLGAVSKT